MPLDLSEAEKYELAELLRQTIAAERDAPSFRTLALQSVLDKLADDEPRSSVPATPRQASIRRFVGEWRQEVTAEDALLRLRAERNQADRRSAHAIGIVLIAAALIGFIAVLAALTL